MKRNERVADFVLGAVVVACVAASLICRKLHSWFVLAETQARKMR
jgi:hypothetical protein